MEILLLIVGIPFFYWVFFICPKKDGTRTKCPQCGSKHTKSQGADYFSAQKVGRVNHIVKCLDCGHDYIARGAHDSSWF